MGTEAPRRPLRQSISRIINRSLGWERETWGQAPGRLPCGQAQHRRSKLETNPSLYGARIAHAISVLGEKGSVTESVQDAGMYDGLKRSASRGVINLTSKYVCARFM